MESQGINMRKFGVTVLALMFAAVHTASAGLFSGPSEKDLEGIHRVAVVTFLGDTFHGIQIGTTVFQNKYFDAPVPQWQMNDRANEEVVRTMALRGLFPAEALKIGDLPVPSLYRKPKDMRVSGEGLQKLLDLAKQQGDEALLIVQQTDGGDNFPFHKPGFGLFRRGAFGMTTQCAYVSFFMELVRVDTGKSIVRRGQEPCYASPEKFEWKPSWDQYSAEEQAALEASVKDHLVGMVDLLLSNMKLLKP
jgi:hypothetical protein